MPDLPTPPPAGGRATAELPERNLLVALLAFQNNFIEREDLLAAIAAWSDRKTISVAELLVEQKKLSILQRQLLETLAAEHLKKHQQNPQLSLSALAMTETSRQVLAEVADVDVQRTMSLLPVRALDNTVSLKDPRVSSRPDHSPGTSRFKTGKALQFAGQRFRVVRPHAEGGLGKVSVARDEELNREVALKEIKPQFAHQVSARSRFLLEAEITGGLEHPGIVPVYSLGTNEEGHPYYAMRFIQGDSLKDAVVTFFAKYGVQAGGDAKLPAGAYKSLEFRGLLARFVTVCNAISYAHSRGVLHRDIKPGNIMIGSFGETLVVDWGLAKVTGQTDQSAGEGTQLAISSASDSVSAETMMGSAIGTLGYMSPEQAAGRVDQFSPATDIYLLGATLYHMLTGEPPHRGQNSNEILVRIQQDEVASPRQFNKAIPAPLAAICLKSMALDANGRYESALDIAAELERYLADEPVKAHREPLTVRVRRTLRKHPALTAAFTATLLVGVIGFGAGYVLLGNKNKQLALTNSQLATATNIARKNELQAETNAVAAQNSAREARQNALEADTRRIESSRLADFWIGLLEGTNPVGHGTAAPIPKAKEQALTVGMMLEVGAQRIKQDSTLTEFPLAHAAILHTMGDVNRQLGRYKEAEPLLEEALRIRRQHSAANSAELAGSCNAMACFYQEKGRYPQADALFAEAVAIRRQLTTPEGKRDLATTLFNLGAMRGHEGELEEAAALFRECIAIREQLPVRSNHDIAIAKMGLAFTLGEAHQTEEALRLVNDSQAAFKDVKGQENVSEAAIHFAIAVMSRHLVGPEIAESQLKTSRENISREFSADSVWMAMIDFEIAKTLQEQKKFDEAEQKYEASLKICREQVQLRHPRVLALVDQYADFLADRGKRAKADSLWQEFLAAHTETYGPQHRVTRKDRLCYAQYLYRLDRTAEEIEVLKQLRIDEQGETRRLQTVLTRLGRAYYESGKYAAANEALQASKQIQWPAEITPADKLAQYDARFWEAVVQLKGEQPTKGKELLQQLLIDAKQLPPEDAREAERDVLIRLLNFGDQQLDYPLAIDAGQQLYKHLGGTTPTAQKGFLGGLSLPIPNPFAASEEHVDVPIIRQRLAKFYERLGQYDKAIPYWQEAVARGEKKHGRGHAQVALYRSNLQQAEALHGEQQFIADNLALNAKEADFPKVTASYSAPAAPAKRVHDGLINYDRQAPQRWSTEGSPNETDWLEVEFAKPTEFSKIEFAVCHEGNNGAIMLPSSCIIEVWDEKAWVPIENVTAEPALIAGNRWNSIQFPTVTTQRVRLVFAHAHSTLKRKPKTAISEVAIWP